MGFQLVKLLNDPVTVTTTLNPEGAYVAETAYTLGDSVSYNGTSYVAIQSTTGNLPTDTTYWQVLAEKGDKGDTGLGITEESVGFTLTGGTTPKTLTVPLDASVSGTNTGDQPLGSRTITGTTNQITVTNGDGVSGNPTLSLPNAITLPGTLTITGHTSPQADSTYTLGTSSLYWKETYTDKLFLNSTATLDGSTAGAIGVTGLLGLGTSAPTHTLTLPSTNTGIAIYNTADQTTNFERFRMFWSSNVLNFIPEKGGSGSERGIVFGAGGTPRLAVNPSANPFFDFYTNYSSNFANETYVRMRHTSTANTGVFKVLEIIPTINQSSTAGYTALLINPTETATGSGAKNLIDAKVGGVSKFKVDNTGGIETTVAGGGIIMASPDGTRYKLTIANGGTVSVTAA